MTLKKRPRFKFAKMLLVEKALQKEGFNLIAGVDESGRGPLAGPVVASAVILRTFSFPVVVKDCKQLTSLARIRAFNEIIKRAYIGMAVIRQDDIDKLNIHKASLLAMRQAVGNLKIKPDCILIDGLYRTDESIKNISMVKGDVHSLSIACASIVAKVFRDRIMQKLDKLYPQYGFRDNKGYGTRRHLRSIEQFGPSPIHRLSFSPCHNTR